MHFLQIETAIKSILAPILETLNQCRSHRDGNEAENDNSEKSSTQFLQMQQNQLIQLHEHFERYCNLLHVSVIKSARYDIKLIKSHLLPVPLIKRDIEPFVIKKCQQTCFVQICYCSTS